jgi:DNA-binding XRE family transcriptional regulator
MRLSHHLVRFRKKHSLLQKEVATLLNISREHYAQIESGKFTPSIKLLRTISKTLRLDIEIRVAHGGSTFMCKPEKLRG